MIHEDLKGLKKRAVLYLIPATITLIVVLFNFKTHFVFYVDANNVYHRGAGVFLIAALLYYQYFIAVYFIIRFKRQMQTEVITSITAYLLVPVASTVFQLLYYGLTLIWPMFVLANVMTFLVLEKNTIIRDHLTGAHTRAEFEDKIYNLIRKKKPFSLLMIDLDFFKEINDRFGHKIGDLALIEVVDILSDSIRKNDLICRYGGDEFMLLIYSDKPSMAEEMKKRILTALETRNRVTKEGYQLEMSIGTMFVPHNYNQSPQTIYEEVDKKMYDEKNRHHHNRENQ